MPDLQIVRDDEDAIVDGGPWTPAEVQARRRALRSYLEGTGWTTHPEFEISIHEPVAFGTILGPDPTPGRDWIVVFVSRDEATMRRDRLEWLHDEVALAMWPFFDVEAFFQGCKARVREALGKDTNEAIDPVTGRSFVVIATNAATEAEGKTVRTRLLAT